MQRKFIITFKKYNYNKIVIKVACNFDCNKIQIIIIIIYYIQLYKLYKLYII